MKFFKTVLVLFFLSICVAAQALDVDNAKTLDNIEEDGSSVREFILSLDKVFDNRPARIINAGSQKRRIEILEEDIKTIEELPAPERCKELKEIILRWERIALETKGYFNEMETGDRNIAMFNAFKNIEVISKLENEYNRERKSILREYDIDEQEDREITY